MSGTIQTRGLVLRQFSYSDSSQIIWVFARNEGIISLLAKGALRLARRSSPFPAPFDVTGWYDIVYRRRRENLYLATEGRLVEGFPHLRTDLASYVDASWALEVILRMFQFADPHPEFLRSALSYLKLLRHGTGRLPLRLHFGSQVLSAAGVAPSWDRCAECHARIGIPAAFRLPLGMLCSGCRRGSDEALPPALVGYFVFELGLPWGRVPSVEADPALLKDAWKLMCRFLHYHTERPLKTLRHLGG